MLNKKELIPPVRLTQLNTDIDKGWDDLVILKGHSSMQSILDKISNMGFEMTSESYSDIEIILEYISEKNKFEAYKMLKAFYKTFVVLLKEPEIGEARPDITDKDVRFYIFKKNYLIVYRQIGTKKLRILRILSTYQDICSEL